MNSTTTGLYFSCEIVVHFDQFQQTMNRFAANTIPARQPVDLRAVSNVFTYQAPGLYNRALIWQVWDNYDLPWTYGGFPVSEYYTDTDNGCNLTIQTDSTFTNNQGRFSDNYGSLLLDPPVPYPACENYPNCVSRKVQHLTVAGRNFENSVDYSCPGVSVTRR